MSELPEMPISTLVNKLRATEDKSRLCGRLMHRSADIVEQLQAERDRYKAGYEAAVNYINESPCDTDIYPEQMKAYEDYLAKKIPLEDK